MPTRSKSVGPSISDTIGAHEGTPANCRSESQPDQSPLTLQYSPLTRTSQHSPYVPCMDGARGAREKNLTFRETIRVQPCIRPLNAAVWAGVPDVVHREAPRKYA